MNVILKIAFRNLKQHRTKTLIIGTLITLGIAVLIIGNSLMDTAADGLRRAYIDSYTGDLIVTGLHTSPVTLFGVQSMDGTDAATPLIPDYDTVYDYVVSHPAVVAVNPQATVMSMIEAADETLDGQMFTALFGIDPEAYVAMFPDNIVLSRGRFLRPGEEGIVLNEAIADLLAEQNERPLEPGDAVLLTGMSTIGGIRVREVPIVGIFQFRVTDPQMEFVSLADITNVRALAGMRLSAVSETELSGAEALLFGELDDDLLFGGGEDALFGGSLVEEVDVAATRLDEQALYSVLGEQLEAVAAAMDSKAWHFLVVKVREGTAAALTADLHQFFREQDIAATTTDWLQGGGSLAALAYGAKAVFNIVIFVIAIVAVIIIMNTLVISVTERTTEIGTMRALGAQKRFVRRMIAWETVLTTGIFGALGIAVGSGVLGILNLIGLEASNVFLEVLYGGKVLRPVPSVSSIGMSIVLVLVIGLVASIYPVSVALKTKPAQAMQS